MNWPLALPSPHSDGERILPTQVRALNPRTVSRGEPAQTYLPGQMERTHVRCYEVHGEGGVPPGEGFFVRFMAPMRIQSWRSKLPSNRSAEHPLCSLEN